MNGRYKADQQGGAGHGCDEEREDGAEGCKAERHTKEAAVYEANGKVELQVFFVFFFKCCEGKHEFILPDVHLLLTDFRFRVK